LGVGETMMELSSGAPITLIIVVISSAAAQAFGRWRQMFLLSNVIF
jgi:hypothetical protein